MPACGRAHAPRAAPLAIARHAVPRAFKAQQAPCAPSNFEVLFIRLIVCVFVVIPGSFRVVPGRELVTETEKIHKESCILPRSAWQWRARVNTNTSEYSPRRPLVVFLYFVFRI